MLHTLTPLHAVPGQTGGKTDVAIQKDAFSLPLIHSTSIKDALKTIFIRIEAYPMCRGTT